MLYIDFEAGNKAYKLRLTTRGIVALEKKLGCNPVSIFGDGTRVPSITQMVDILHASLQTYHHGITLDDTYNLFDEYLADGHTMVDFIPVIVDIYKSSGIIGNDKVNNSKEAEEDEKN